jgi:hypothetical protein
MQPPPDVRGRCAREEDVELRERPPGRRPPAGVHEQRACRGAVGGGQPLPGRRKRPAWRGVPRTCPPTDCRWPPSNPCRRGPRKGEPHEEWALRVSPAAAIRQPVGLREWLVDAILHREAVNQRWPGGCSVCSRRTTTQGRMGEAATI